MPLHKHLYIRSLYSNCKETFAKTPDAGFTLKQAAQIQRIQKELSNFRFGLLMHNVHLLLTRINVESVFQKHVHSQKSTAHVYFLNMDRLRQSYSTQNRFEI